MKRRKVFALVLLAVIGGGIAYWRLNRSDEPEYQGRRLSAWLGQEEQAQWPVLDSNRREEARTAVRNIGTNALPHFLAWIRYEPPAWRQKFHGKLPQFISNRKAIENWLLTSDARKKAMYATRGFAILGTNAVSVIPELEVWMKDNAAPDRSARASAALACIGEPAIPALRAALADTNQINRWKILHQFGLIAVFHGTNLCLPTLREALNDHDIGVRNTATNNLKWISPETLTNAPAQ